MVSIRLQREVWAPLSLEAPCPFTEVEHNLGLCWCKWEQTLAACRFSQAHHTFPHRECWQNEKKTGQSKAVQFMLLQKL